ncbi:hypothetical protein [Pseudoxanthomonas sp. 10H]|uniref:hypothetical protein n=1 Tax=Pseudoxanthomonas sp. 10H TaxID=3242729 RepID=UPI003558E4B4
MYRDPTRPAAPADEGIPDPAKPAPARAARERRKASSVDPQALRDGLTPPQLVTLEALQIFQWELAFVRRPLFQAPVPVLFDRARSRHVVIQEDGTLDEHPSLRLRD